MKILTILESKIIKLLFEYSDEDNDSFRQCSKSISLMVGNLYFSKMYVNINKIINNYLFRQFVHKYNLSINVIHIKKRSELAYLQTYNVKNVIIDHTYNNRYLEYFFPLNVEVLYLFNLINKYIVLPTTLKRLYLEIYEKPNRKKSINIAITKKKRGHKNYVIISNTLEELLISTDRQIDALPLSLLKLTIAGKFNHKINNILPETLQELNLTSCHFNKIIEKGTLPKSLKKLYLPRHYNNIICELPLSLIIFHTGNHSIKNILPFSLTELHLNNNIILDKNDLPPNLKKLQFGQEYNKIIKRNILPESLEELIFGHDFNQLLDEHIFPLNIIKLTFGYNFNHFVKRNVLPNNLEKLKFGNTYNKMLYIGVLPQSLKIIEFGSNYNKPINKNVLPNSIRSLIFGNNFNQQFNENALPQSLKELILGNEYSRPFLENILPNNLEYLTIGENYKSTIVASKSIKNIKKIFYTTNPREEMNIVL